MRHQGRLKLLQRLDVARRASDPDAVDGGVQAGHCCRVEAMTVGPRPSCGDPCDAAGIRERHLRVDSQATCRASGDVNCPWLSPANRQLRTGLRFRSTPLGAEVFSVVQTGPFSVGCRRGTSSTCGHSQPHGPSRKLRNGPLQPSGQSSRSSAPATRTAWRSTVRSSSSTSVSAYAVGLAASKAPLPGLGVGVASDDLRDALRELRR
jgi:hypothetical protein